MAEPRHSSTSAASSDGSSILPDVDTHVPSPQSTSAAAAAIPPRPAVSLLQPPSERKAKNPHHPTRILRVFRSVVRSFPIITPKCAPRFPSSTPILCLPGDPVHRRRSSRIAGGTRITGTLFGYRKGRVSLSLQDSPNCLPSLIIELAIQTNALLREMASGMVRIALECEKKVEREKGARLLDEGLWTMFCNGKKSGYGVRREATEEDLGVMEFLHASSMGAGVLPGGKGEGEGGDGELAFMRAAFEHVVGSKDSETLYMISPDGNTGPDLTIFFVRI